MIEGPPIGMLGSKETFYDFKNRYPEIQGVSFYVEPPNARNDTAGITIYQSPQGISQDIYARIGGFDHKRVMSHNPLLYITSGVSNGKGSLTDELCINVQLDGAFTFNIIRNETQTVYLAEYLIDRVRRGLRMAELYAKLTPEQRKKVKNFSTYGHAVTFTGDVAVARNKSYQLALPAFLLRLQKNNRTLKGWYMFDGGWSKQDMFDILRCIFESKKLPELKF